MINFDEFDIEEEQYNKYDCYYVKITYDQIDKIPCVINRGTVRDVSGDILLDRIPSTGFDFYAIISYDISTITVVYKSDTNCKDVVEVVTDKTTTNKRMMDIVNVYGDMLFCDKSKKWLSINLL